ncbi:hypothetical protein Heshes_20070 [Alicyclobacillus hesperidum]|uniref:Prepilin-type N-terminal cleavage/methylation domain-containing protein n=1 Tax=Alicyclobacillus hesperidum TaxID=89784 RepID=A0AA37U9V3_9BACL|nr:hypothetical protein Heshes_20070 [Alicyclobacillus hesperidum]
MMGVRDICNLWLRRAKRHDGQAGLTLIEVMASVVMIALAGTAALLAVGGAQAGTLKMAQYDQALGLATTIAEEIKDRPQNIIGWVIEVPGDALGNEAQSSIILIVPPPGITFSWTYPLYNGFQCTISSNATNNSANVDYKVQVQTPQGLTATVTAPVLPSS